MRIEERVGHRAASIAFQTDKPIRAYGPLAAQVEAYGFHGVSVYNDMLYQPAWLPLLEIARATHRVRIGAAAVNPFTCHPINMAGNIALIDEAASGRAYLGVARGGWLDFLGLTPKHTVTALRETFACVRHLLEQRKEPLDGKVFSLAGGDSLRWSILRPDVPFLLGSWGAKTIQACVDAVAEVKIGGSANPDVIPVFRRMLDGAAASQEGAASQERERARVVDIAIGAVTVVDGDGEAARARARREIALYLPVVAELDSTVSIEPERLARLRAAADRYDFQAAADLISDDLLRRFALAGTPDAVAQQAAELFEAGAQRVEFGTPHGLDPATGLELLGTAVLPALQRAGVVDPAA